MTPLAIVGTRALVVVVLEISSAVKMGVLKGCLGHECHGKREALVSLLRCRAHGGGMGG